MNDSVRSTSFPLLVSCLAVERKQMLSVLHYVFTERVSYKKIWHQLPRRTVVSENVLANDLECHMLVNVFCSVLHDTLQSKPFCCLPVHWNVLWFRKPAITSTILNLNQVPLEGKSEVLSFWSHMSRGGSSSKVSCLRSEHILSTASSITIEPMNWCVCYTHLFSSGWITRDVHGSNVITRGPLSFLCWA